MSCRLVTTAFLAVIWFPPQISAASLAADLHVCRGIISDDQRLTCYDALQITAEGDIFTGKGSGITPEFTVDAPRLMRFNSADVIMVVYLMDDSGRVVQNLHRGGAGGGEYLIETPGLYHVQVNASGDWKVHILP